MLEIEIDALEIERGVYQTGEWGAVLSRVYLSVTSPLVLAGGRKSGMRAV